MTFSYFICTYYSRPYYMCELVRCTTGQVVQKNYTYTNTRICNDNKTTTNEIKNRWHSLKHSNALAVAFVVDLIISASKFPHWTKSNPIDGTDQVVLIIKIARVLARQGEMAGGTPPAVSKSRDINKIELFL